MEHLNWNIVNKQAVYSPVYLYVVKESWNTLETLHKHFYAVTVNYLGYS